MTYNFSSNKVSAKGLSAQKKAAVAATKKGSSSTKKTVTTNTAQTLSDSWNKDVVTLAEAKAQSTQAANYLYETGTQGKSEVSGVSDSWNKGTVSLAEASAQTSQAESFVVASNTQAAEKEAAAAQAQEAPVTVAEAKKQSQVGQLMSQFNFDKSKMGSLQSTPVQNIVNGGTTKKSTTSTVKVTGAQSAKLVAAANMINNNKYESGNPLEGSAFLNPGETPTKTLTQLVAQGYQAGKSGGETGIDVSYNAGDYSKYALYKKASNASENVVKVVEGGVNKGAKTTADLIPDNTKTIMLTGTGVKVLDAADLRRGVYGTANVVTGAVEGVASTVPLVASVPLAVEMAAKNPGKTAKAAAIGVGLIAGGTVLAAKDNPTRLVGNILGGIAMGKVSEGVTAKVLPKTAAKVVTTPETADVVTGYTLQKGGIGASKEGTSATSRLVAKIETIPTSEIRPSELSAFAKMNKGIDRILESKYLKSTVKEGNTYTESGSMTVKLKANTGANRMAWKSQNSNLLESLRMASKADDVKSGTGTTISGGQQFFETGNAPAVAGSGRVNLPGSPRSGVGRTEVSAVGKAGNKAGKTSYSTKLNSDYTLEVDMPKTVNTKARPTRNVLEKANGRNVLDVESGADTYEYIRAKITASGSETRATEGVTGRFKLVEKSSKNTIKQSSLGGDMEGGVVKTGKTKTVAQTWEMKPLTDYAGMKIVSEEVLPLAYDSKGMPTNALSSQKTWMGLSKDSKGIPTSTKKLLSIEDDYAPAASPKTGSVPTKKITIAGESVSPGLKAADTTTIKSTGYSKMGSIKADALDKVPELIKHEKSEIPSAKFAQKPRTVGDVYNKLKINTKRMFRDNSAETSLTGQRSGSSSSLVSKAKAGAGIADDFSDVKANQILSINEARSVTIPGKASGLIPALSVGAGFAAAVAPASMIKSKSKVSVSPGLSPGIESGVSIGLGALISSDVNIKQNVFQTNRQIVAPVQAQRQRQAVVPKLAQATENKAEQATGIASITDIKMPGYKRTQSIAPTITVPVLMSSKSSGKRGKKSNNTGVNKKSQDTGFKSIWELI